MMKEDTVLIIGSGSMACLFAACLVRSGQDVLMFSEWEEGVRAIQEHGIRLHDSQGDQPAVHPSATTRPNDCAGARNVLLLVKSWQTETAAELLKTRLHPRGVVLTLQNGLGNDEILAAALGKKRTAAGITTLGAYMLGPAHIHAELGGEVILAEHPALAELHSRLQQAGLTVSQVPDLASLQWGKLVVNSAVNPLSVLLEASNIELLTDPYARHLLEQTVLETAGVAAALGISLPYPDPFRHLVEVLQRTPHNQTSMLQDYRRGALTEIEAINGAVIRRALACQVPAPFNQTLYDLVNAKISRR